MQSYKDIVQEGWDRATNPEKFPSKPLHLVTPQEMPFGRLVFHVATRADWLGQHPKEASMSSDEKQQYRATFVDELNAREKGFILYTPGEGIGSLIARFSDSLKKVECVIQPPNPSTGDRAVYNLLNIREECMFRNGRPEGYSGLADHVRMAVHNAGPTFSQDRGINNQRYIERSEIYIMNCIAELYGKE